MNRLAKKETTNESVHKNRFTNLLDSSMKMGIDRSLVIISIHSGWWFLTQQLTTGTLS